MNSEIDLIFGPLLLRLANEKGVVYTSCDGDQHGVLKHLVDEIRMWGFDLVMAGNIKGFLDRYSDPQKIIPEADARNLNYKMATAYTDGTKLGVEMALVANALGLSVLTPGMRGPRAKDVQEVFELFDFDSIRASGEAVVDYILGAQPGGGVFVIGHCDNVYQQGMLSYYKMGNGPFYLFYRPYHLCHIEAMGCIASACLDQKSLLKPEHGLRTNVYAYAKRSLRKGEKLDGVGGFTCYGLIEKTDSRGIPGGLPICLAEQVALKHDVPKDGRILLDDVEYDGQRIDFNLYFKSLPCEGHYKE
jgi:predicted homoserine dehydrogenase-like protein